MSMSTEYRCLTQDETKLISHLLGKNVSEREALQKQLATALVRVIDSEGSIEFSGADVGPQKLISEGESKDLDGIPVHALLFVKGSHLSELEIYKDNGITISKLPDADSFEIL
jgi:hypothetical protein